MSTFELESPVGGLVHVISQYGFRLSSKCSIQLSYPSRNDDLSITSSKLKSVGINGLWAGRGDGLRIYLCLITDGLVVDTMERQKLIEGLGAVVRDSEIWSQLLFRASLTIPAHDALQRRHDADIVLLLSCLEDSSPKGRLKLSRNTFTALDAKPPEGVASAKVEGIRLNLEFSRIRPSTHKRRKTDVHTGFEESLDSSESLFSSDDTSYLSMLSSSPSLRSLPFFESSQGSDSSYMSSQPTVRISEGMLEEEYEYETATHGKTLQTHNVPVTSAHLHYRHLKSPRKRSGSGELLKSSFLGLSASAKLLDAAFRAIICDNRTVLLPGVKLEEKTSEPKLAEILPAVFSPGYLQAISQRNHFIPRIAYSISSVARSSKSSLLLVKLDALSNQSPSGDYRNQDSHITDIHSRITQMRNTAIMKMHLWKTIQLQLYDPLAARHLKPLRIDTVEISPNATGSNDMLDEVSSPSSPPDRFHSPISHTNHVDWPGLLFNGNVEKSIQYDGDDLCEEDAFLLDDYINETSNEDMLDETEASDDILDNHNSPHQNYALSYHHYEDFTDLDLMSDMSMLDFQERLATPSSLETDEILLS